MSKPRSKICSNDLADENELLRITNRQFTLQSHSHVLHNMHSITERPPYLQQISNTSTKPRRFMAGMSLFLVLSSDHISVSISIAYELLHWPS